MRETLINAKWPITLPQHRADWHEARPWWEAPRLADMHERIEPGMRLVDIGSEEGDLTSLYASWGAEVSFIDPSQTWINQTLETFQANNLTPGAHFAGFAADHNRGGGSWTTSDFAHLNERDDLPRIKLDSFCESVDALMIDTEGSELQVLRGAQRLLEAKPVVWVSVHPEFMKDRYGVTETDLVRFLESFGYEGEFLDGHHELDYRFT